MAISYRWTLLSALALFFLSTTCSFGAITSARLIGSDVPILSATTDAPQIISVTGSFSIMEGTSTNLQVEASGAEPLEYVWQRNGQPLAGETNATLILTNIGIANAGNYDVTVRNRFGVRQSSAIVVSVNILPKIHNTTTNIVVGAGESLTFQANVSGTDPLTYRWWQEGRLLSSSGIVRLRNVQARDNGPIWLILTNAFGAVSNVVADLTIVPRKPLIVRQPSEQTLRTNSPVLFTAGVIGTEPMEFQWLKNGSEITGATNRGFVIGNPQAADLAEYSVVISNSAGVSTSDVARLTDQVVTNTIVEWPSIDREVVATGLAQLTGITHAGDGSGRLFVIEQVGRVRVIENGVVVQTPFLDVTERVSSGGERGLLGITFAPDFKESGEFYLNYTRKPDGATVVSRFMCEPGSESADTNEVVLLTIAQPTELHNGGHIAFGPDGYLYIATGDGGGGYDFYNNAQNTTSLLGKILRIDVSGGLTSYTIPPSNPFMGREDYRPEIWALGLRNPWRFSFDRLTGDMFIADVGESAREELNFQRRNSAGGENYGWPIFEARLRTPRPLGTVNTNEMVFPITEYPRPQGSSITGGYVSRNPEQERMWGVYFYADYISNRGWALRQNESATSETNRWISPIGNFVIGRVTTFGEDEDGNIYAAVALNAASSQVVRLIDAKIAAAPTFSLRPGVYTGGQTVTITADPGARIHYRFDGVAPTEADPFVYSGGTLFITGNQNIRARAYRADLQPSIVVPASYTLIVPVALSPGGNLVTNGTLLTLTSALPDVTIRYTLDGTEVTEASPLYTNAIVLTGNQTLRATGYKEGWNNAAISHYFGLLDPVKFAWRPVAGTGERGFSNGVAANATFNEPQGLAFDVFGNLYVADNRNAAVRKISTNGIVTTVLGSEVLVVPVGLTFDAAGNLLVGDADGNRIYKMTPSGDLATVAGTGVQGLDDGPVETARVSEVSYVEIANDGTVYFSDFAMIRMVSTDGQVARIADDGGNNAFRLSNNNGLAISPGGELFAASQSGRVFKIGGTEPLEHFAGAGPVIGSQVFPSDGPRLAAFFHSNYYHNRPVGREIIFDGTGKLYVGDGTRVRIINGAGDVSTVVFSLEDPVNDGSPFKLVTGFAFDAKGALHVADIRGNAVWKIAPDSDNDDILDTDEGEGTVYLLGENDRLRDSDGDGMSNTQEYLGGTDPSVANPVDRLSVEMGDGVLLLRWVSVAHPVGRLERSSDLENWSDAGAIGSEQVSNPISESNVFFRVVGE